MKLLDRIASGKSWTAPPSWAFDDYRMHFLDASSSWGDKEAIDATFTGLVQGAFKRNGILFALCLTRQMIFSEADIAFQRRLSGTGRPGDLYWTPELELLQKPWNNATTGDLLSRMIQDADLAGNAFMAKRNRAGRKAIRRLRPEWVTIVLGSEDPATGEIKRAENPWEIDAEVIAYMYEPGGIGNDDDSFLLMPDEVAHFAPIPDPTARYRGMSWITPVIRELEADNAATAHKLKFFKNGATPQVVVSLDKEIKQAQFEKFVKLMEAKHRGLAHAYKTWYLGGGADVTVVGKDLRQLDFRNVQGAGETRMAAAAGVPPVIAGFSEGLQAATYSNYGQARRRYADGTMRPLWRNAAGSLASVCPAPGGDRLWYDARDIAFLREDLKDIAEIQAMQATTIRTLTDSGFTPESVTAAVIAEDFTLLQHTGLFSVQLQPPGTADAAAAVPVTDPKQAIELLTKGWTLAAPIPGQE